MSVRQLLTFIAYIIALSLLAVLCSAQSKLSWQAKKQQREAYLNERRQHEVDVSMQVWKFDRVYPFLDGIFQDVAATQVASLSLNPNGPNGTYVDALQQSLQIQLQYSQMAGIQNAAAAQAMTANGNYQSQLADQQASLLKQLSDAYAAVAKAESDLEKLNSSGTASATDVAAAQQTLTGANNNLAAVGTAISNLKNLAAVSVPSAASPLVSTPTLPSLTSSALPSGITSAVPGTSGTPPSFPPTKQMDNQVNILWDRLARLVSTLSRSDDVGPDKALYLVKFDTSIAPLNRNKQLLEMRYAVNCDGRILDLFPRNAALNIVQDKYKDSAFGFGAVLNWFGVGGSVAYNREHLKASQLLGQSSYISGNGVGQSEFGWLFGITLGDNSLAPGPRTTFAVVSVPTSCAAPAISVKEVNWVKTPDFKIQFPKTSLTSTLLLKQSVSSDCKDCVDAIEFNRIEYDPTVGKPAPVTVRITLNREMDQEQTVSVNGQFIQRVRDNFGRAISPTISGSNGVLETGQMGTNTWVPTSATTMLVTLDASQFGNRFPQILLSSPSFVIDVVQSRKSDSRDLVSGIALACDAPPCILPSLGFPKSKVMNLGIARWIAPAAGGYPAVDSLSITVLNPDTTTSTATGSSLPAVPTVQVISDTNNPEWSSDTEVYLIESNDMRRLNCPEIFGSRLVCIAPDRATPNGQSRPPLKLTVIDQHHAGGTSIEGTVSTQDCKNDSGGQEQSCRRPLIWKTIAPILIPDKSNPPQLSKSKWMMWIQAVNVNSTDQATLGSLAPASPFTCPVDPHKACAAAFSINMGDLNSISNWMTFKVQDHSNNNLGSSAVITNVLENVKPLIGQISDDRTSWYGRNLVFNTIRVGDSKPYQVSCVTDGIHCSGDGKYGSQTGFLYFVAGTNLAFPFKQANTTTGVNSGVTYAPPKTTDQVKPGGAAAAAPAAPASTLQNLYDLPDLKQKLAMQAFQ